MHKNFEVESAVVSGYLFNLCGERREPSQRVKETGLGVVVKRELYLYFKKIHFIEI